MATLTLQDGTTVNAALGGRSIDGDEPLIVLVHGAGMDRTVWQMQTRYLAHHGFRVAAIDLPGHGATPGDPCASIPDYAAWLSSVIAGLGQGPVHLAGHSLGAFISLEAAAMSPDLIQTLTLLGVAAAMPVHPVLLDAAANDVPLAGQLMSGWGFAAASKVGRHPSPGASMVGGTQALLEAGAPGVLANDLKASGAYEGAVEAAAKVTAPTTLILGSNDRMTPLRGASDLIDAFADVTVVLLEGSGHMMTIERPDEVRDAMLQAVQPV